MSTLVRIKQLPDDYAESTGLAKYNRSRMPGCKDGYHAAVNIDGRYVTGIDEEAYGITPERAEQLLERRLRLEKATGKDLSGLSPFWKTFMVQFYTDKPKTFDLSVPMDEVSFTMLVASHYVAPSEDAIMTPEYREAQYYAFTEEGEAHEEVLVTKKRDKAVSALLDISDDKDKMVLYGQYLEGIKYSDKFKEDTLYKMLRAYIDDKDPKKAANFLQALTIPVEDIQQKIIVDKAIKHRLINKVSVGGKKHVYQYGQVTLGTTLEEVYSNLSKPDFVTELLALKEAVNR